MRSKAAACKIKNRKLHHTAKTFWCNILQMFLCECFCASACGGDIMFFGLSVWLSVDTVCDAIFRFSIDQGCTLYFTDCARNISGREVGPQCGSGGCALSGVQGQSPWSGVQGTKLMTIYWYSSYIFALIAMFMKKSNCN